MRQTLTSALGLFFLSAGLAFAQSVSPVAYPIAQLNNCGSKAECKAYCDIAANRDACYAYAQTHGLMTKDQVALARKLQSAVGPGGCQGEACKTYCNDSAHGQLCIAFAQKNGFISKAEADARFERMKFASTTRELPVTATGTIASTTQPRPHLPPPPKSPETGGQSSSIFFALLHFFGF